MRPSRSSKQEGVSNGSMMMMFGIISWLLVVVAASHYVDATMFRPMMLQRSHRLSAFATTRTPFLLVKIRGGSLEDETVADDSKKGDVQSEDEETPEMEESESTSSSNTASETTAAETANDGDNVGESSSLSEDTDVATDDLVASSKPSMVAPAVVETTTTTVLDHQPSVALDEDSQQEQDEEEYENEEEEEEGEESIDAEPLTPDQIQTAVEQASELRTLGKELHDKGDFAQAATQFASAADRLFQVLNSNDDSVADDFATCRLHAALCFLKAGDYEETIKACTDVLDLPAGESSSSSSSVEPALRARAFHRRAKAQVELGNEEAALEDARSAAFLGDRRAVALYGKLMRESSSSALVNGGGGGDDNSLAASSALFESLLNKSKGGSVPSMNPDSLGDIGNIFPSSLFDMMGAGAGTGGGNNDAGSLAKSVLSSLSKRLHEESTQDQICTYLQSTSGPQLQQMASLAGIQLPEAQANRLASFCNGVTPKTIQRTLRTTKVAYFVFKMVRKISQLISKYRSIIILIILVGWIKSAVLRPLPVNKKAARIAAKQAAKTAAAAATVTEAM